ncbi:MAG: DUF4412 domain-containing protein [Bacteroidales bacterium]|nr:DUF4412 domain-containing protein [Bacteroidales bacterium]
MRKTVFFVFALLFVRTASGQHVLTYQSYAKGSDRGDTTFIRVLENNRQLMVNSLNNEVKNPIPGYVESVTCVDYSLDSVFTLLQYDEAGYYSAYPLADNDVVFTEEGKEKVLGYPCTKYKTSINSNTIEVWMAEKPGFEATPMPQLGRLKGVMVRCMRNGSYVTDLKVIKKDKSVSKTLIPREKGRRMTSRELSQLRKDKLVMRIPVFKDEQIHFADYEPFTDEIPYDTTIHFSHGTVIVKRMQLPQLPEHYQLFAEIHQRSNGDAYDRTASVFVIPTEKAKSFRNGLQQGVEALPVFKGKDGKEYQGIKAENDYLPPVELVRFFTSFGAGHFNDKVQIDGLKWTEENYYKQEISELRDRLQGDVLIGAFIGNYDRGGHKLSLDLVAYPGDYEWDETPCHQHSIPLFNTCNVMEMSGQNYGRLFATDSLEVSFEIPESATNMRLRYISTGHGGWGGGDEFNPKENVIYIDGERRFAHTPWRCDCATFRDQNPVSGNFWNGVSSSDYSRSGWCPGTATNPVYFDLSDLKPGRHSIRIAIPQGMDEGGSFSHWMVSGLLLLSY